MDALISGNFIFLAENRAPLLAGPSQWEVTQGVGRAIVLNVTDDDGDTVQLNHLGNATSTSLQLTDADQQLYAFTWIPADASVLTVM